MLRRRVHEPIKKLRFLFGEFVSTYVVPVSDTLATLPLNVH